MHCWLIDLGNFFPFFNHHLEQTACSCLVLDIDPPAGDAFNFNNHTKRCKSYQSPFVLGVDGVQQRGLIQVLDDLLRLLPVLPILGEHLEQADLVAFQRHGLNHRAVLVRVEHHAGVDGGPEPGPRPNGSEVIVRIIAVKCHVPIKGGYEVLYIRRIN